jgi:hypothetical protein
MCLSLGSGPAETRATCATVFDAWLLVVDSGKYADSWDEAAQPFKASITKEKWQSALEPVRTPQGKVLSRKLNSAKYAQNPPNAPEGEYLILQYNTDFENKRGALETVVPTLDKDGKWRVSGYFIR